jgi:hypothetical protein
MFKKQRILSTFFWLGLFLGTTTFAAAQVTPTIVWQKLYQSYELGDFSSHPVTGERTIDHNGDNIKDFIFVSHKVISVVSGADGTILKQSVPYNTVYDSVVGSEFVDLNNDGIKDVIVFIRNLNFADKNTRLEALDGQSLSLLWTYKDVTMIYGDILNTKTDLNGDNIPDVAVGIVGKLNLHSGKDGQLLWSFNLQDITPGLKPNKIDHLDLVINNQAIAIPSPIVTINKQFLIIARAFAANLQTFKSTWYTLAVSLNDGSLVWYNVDSHSPRGIGKFRKFGSDVFNIGVVPNVDYVSVLNRLDGKTGAVVKSDFDPCLSFQFYEPIPNPSTRSINDIIAVYDNLCTSENKMGLFDVSLDSFSATPKWSVPDVGINTGDRLYNLDVNADGTKDIFSLAPLNNQIFIHDGTNGNLLLTYEGIYLPGHLMKFDENQILVTASPSEGPGNQLFLLGF